LAIISVSLNSKILGEMDGLQDELGFSGRSEVIRAGLRMLIADKKERSKIRGNINAILLSTHDEKHAKDISELEHSYQEIIKTQLHNCIEDHKCLEVFILSGDARKIREMYEGFQASRKTENVRLIIS